MLIFFKSGDPVEVATAKNLVVLKTSASDKYKVHAYHIHTYHSFIHGTIRT